MSNYMIGYEQGPQIANAANLHLRGRLRFFDSFSALHVPPCLLSSLVFIRQL